MADTTDGAGHDQASRRDFLVLATGAVGAAGVAAAVWPFIHSMNPSADVLALSSTEVDIAKVEVGQAITVTWRGKPVFVRHRTEKEIKEAADADWRSFRDPEPDTARAPKDKPQWIIVVGICTHLGCVPLGQKPGEPRGEYDGWFCPCHGSQYDTSGRIRKGPAPANLPVPQVAFLTDTKIRIG